jgi:hypothetical protein
MRLLGVERVEQLGLRHVSFVICPLYKHQLTSLLQINTRMTEQQIYDGPAALEPLRREFRARL